MAMTTAVVIETKGNYAVIQAKCLETCETCGSKGACHATHVENNVIEMDAINRIKAHVGDMVSVEIPDKTILGASFLVYIVPVIFFIAGALIGNSMKVFGLSANASTLVVGGFFGVISFVIPMFALKLLPGFEKSLTPVIVSKAAGSLKSALSKGGAS